MKGEIMMPKRIEENKIGERGEFLICSLAKSSESFQDFLKNCLRKIRVVDDECLITSCSTVSRSKAEKVRKTDLVLKLNCGGREVKIGVSVKTRKEHSRPDSHLDRRWLEDWRETLNIPSDICECLWMGIIGLASGKTRSLVPLEMRDKVKNFFLQHIKEFLEEAIRGGEASLKVFSVVEYSSRQACVYFFNVDDVITVLEENIKEKGVRFDSVIYLGDFVWVQRKGGDGKHVKVPETDPRHPGNQLQVKIKAVELVEHIVKGGKAQYCGPYCVGLTSLSFDQNTLIKYVKPSQSSSSSSSVK